HRAVDPRGVSVGDPSGLLGQTNGFTEIWIGPQSHRSHPHRSPVSVRPLPSELATGGFLPPGAIEDTLEIRGDTGPVTPMWFRLPFPGESQRHVLPGEATALEYRLGKRERHRCVIRIRKDESTSQQVVDGRVGHGSLAFVG